MSVHREPTDPRVARIAQAAINAIGIEAFASYVFSDQMQVIVFVRVGDNSTMAVCGFPSADDALAELRKRFSQVKENPHDAPPFPRDPREPDL